MVRTWLPSPWYMTYYVVLSTTYTTNKTLHMFYITFFFIENIRNLKDRISIHSCHPSRSIFCSTGLSHIARLFKNKTQFYKTYFFQPDYSNQSRYSLLKTQPIIQNENIGSDPKCWLRQDKNSTYFFRLWSNLDSRAINGAVNIKISLPFGRSI